MRSILGFLQLLGLLSPVLSLAVEVVPTTSIVKPVHLTFEDGLRSLLSPNATISHNLTDAPRWSEYNAPTPGTVVNVAIEQDVQTTVIISPIVKSSMCCADNTQVQYCVKRNVPFLAQNGGHGWIDSFHLGKNGVLINLRGLNNTIFNADKTQARVQGGALISEVINQAYANNAQIITGNCNCVGTLGAALGGGYGNLMGLYGFSVDNIISMNVVLANGRAVTVTASDTDLFWALRGAGPNFGIVTSAEMKSYPMPKAQNMAWFGGLYYTEDKIEKVVQGIQDLTLQSHMNIFLYFATSGAPSFTPVVLVTPFFFGSEADGRAAFKSILDIGPFNDTTTELPYNEWNSGADGFCIKGERKPSYAAGFLHMVPTTWRQIWNAYIAFLQHPGTGSSVVFVECYSLGKAQSIPTSSASFANRDVRFNGVAIPWYADRNLDPIAEAFGSEVRELWRSTDGLLANRT